MLRLEKHSKSEETHGVLGYKQIARGESALVNACCQNNKLYFKVS